MTNYSGAYPPNFEINVKNQDISGKVFSKDKSRAGSCAIIENEDKFDCKVKFGAPPKELLVGTNHDLSAPSLSTRCTEESNDSGDKSIINF